MVINGLTVGDKIQSFLNHAEIIDETNNLQADLHYNPWSDNTYKGMMKRGVLGGLKKLASFGKKKKDDEEHKRADDVHINIYQIAGNYEAGKKLKDD